MIGQVLNILTLGIYGDLSKLIPHASTPVSMIVAYLLVGLRLLVAGMVICAVSKKLLSRFGKFYPYIATAIALVAIVVITHPWVVAKDMSYRFGGFAEALNDPKAVQFTPTLVKVMNFGIITNKINELKPKKIYLSVPDFKDGKLVTSKVSIDWLYYVVSFIIVVITFYFLKEVSKKLAVVAVASEVAIFFGVSTNLVISTVAMIGLGYLAYYLFKHGYGVFAIYPLIVDGLILMSMLELPKCLVVITLTLMLYLTLIPMFYAIGLAISSLGELVEMREKAGMKVKPKKVIEEQAGEWDPVAVSIVLSAIFMLALSLFGVNLVGLMTFLGLSLWIFK